MLVHACKTTHLVNRNPEGDFCWLLGRSLSELRSLRGEKNTGLQTFGNKYMPFAAGAAQAKLPGENFELRTFFLKSSVHRGLLQTIKDGANTKQRVSHASTSRGCCVSQFCGKWMVHSVGALSIFS